MKIPITYGVLIAIVNAIITLILFFLGYQSDAAKLASLGLAPTILMTVVSITGMTLAVRARRAEDPETERFTYGRGYVTAFLTGLIAGLLGTGFYLLYLCVINPDIMAIQLQIQTNNLAAKGLNAQQIDGANKMMGFFLKPAVQFVMGILTSSIFSALIALIIAAFFRREPARLRSEAATPPPLA